VPICETSTCHERQQKNTKGRDDCRAIRLPRLLYARDGMIWFFDRDGERLRYEISRDRVAGRYRVVITRPDGSESIEEVDEPGELIERSVALMNSLRSDGWHVG
jgi:hypothetical protein